RFLFLAPLFLLPISSSLSLLSIPPSYMLGVSVCFGCLSVKDNSECFMRNHLNHYWVRCNALSRSHTLSLSLSPSLSPSLSLSLSLFLSLTLPCSPCALGKEAH